MKSKLDETRLREIAQAAEGFYLHLENGPQTMKQLFTDGLGKMKVADINARLSRQPIERYEWPLAGAILLFALALLINDRKRAKGATTAPRPTQKAVAVAALCFSSPLSWATRRFRRLGTYTSSRNFRRPTSISSKP